MDGPTYGPTYNHSGRCITLRFTSTPKPHLWTLNIELKDWRQLSLIRPNHLDG